MPLLGDATFQSTVTSWDLGIGGKGKKKAQRDLFDTFKTPECPFRQPLEVRGEENPKQAHSDTTDTTDP